jgi:membrane protease YdiL (CAAX protease family)
VLLTEQSPGPVFVVTVTQAVSFGVAHWSGIPFGTVGVVAAALFSAILTLIKRGWGLLPTALVHLVADIVIFGTVLAFAIYAP